MRCLSRTSLFLVAAALGLVFPLAASAQDKTDDNSKSISFKTYDGVELAGRFYPATKREAVVILLHDFTQKEGGSSSKGKWSTLAKTLQNDGYAVLSFDFRGFGDSKRVAPAFWSFPHNGPTHIKKSGGLKQPETIDQKNFQKSYYPYLMNDIAAAKAYLDRRNDANEVNSSNVILIGAGQGATLGAMWSRNECFRYKDKNPNPGFGVPMLSADPESKDLAGCIWLSLSPTLEGRAFGAKLQTWLTEVARTSKVPMGFFFGKQDSKGDNFASGLVKHIKEKSKDLPVAARPIDQTKEVGSGLLESVAANKKILEDLGKVMESRGSKERLDRKVDASAYYYRLGTGKKALAPVLNKKPGEDAPGVDLAYFLAK